MLPVVTRDWNCCGLLWIVFCFNLASINLTVVTLLTDFRIWRRAPLLDKMSLKLLLSCLIWLWKGTIRNAKNYDNTVC